MDPSPLDGEGRRWPCRYDLLLLAIPAAFVAGAVLATATGVPFRVAIPAAAGVSTLAVVDGLFLNPPRRPRVGNGPA